MILPDWQIAYLAQQAQMIDPFVPSKTRKLNGHLALSYGLGHYGYDIRLAEDEIMIACASCWEIDPKNPQAPRHFTPGEVISSDNGKYFVLPGSTFALTSTVEYFKIPPDVTGLVWGKSTYARWGILILCTPLEAGWHGNLTVEIANTGWDPVRIYLGEGIAQIVFFHGAACRADYSKYESAYQGQKGLTFGGVKEIDQPKT